MPIKFNDKYQPISEDDMFMIPAAMKAAPRWVVWGGSKIPVNGNAQNKEGFYVGADATDPAAWMSYNSAARLIGAACKVRGEYFHVCGIGFVVGDGWFCIDADGGKAHGREPVPEAVISDLCKRTGTYAEMSISKNGCHVFGRCGFVTEDRKEHYSESKTSFEIEFFTRRKFLIVTGNQVPGSALDAVDCSGAAKEIYNEYVLTGCNKREAEEQKRREEYRSSITIDPNDAEQFFLLNYPEILDKADVDHFKRGGPGGQLAHGEYSWIGAIKAMDEIGVPRSAIYDWCSRGKSFAGEKDIDRVLDEKRSSAKKASTASIIKDAIDNGWKPDKDKLTGEYKAAYEAALARYAITETVDPETGEVIKVHIANPSAATPAEKKRSSKQKDRRKYYELVRDLMNTAKIRQFGKALYRIVDGKYYRLLSDIFINHELIAVRGMEPEKQNAAQTMIKAFQREEDVAYDSYCVGFKNGVMNWKTTEFVPYESNEAPIFRYFDVNYNQDADTSFVDGIITDWCQGDDAKKEMLFELAGCCLYSDKPIKKWWAIEGKADTGKSTFLELLRSIIGTDNIGNTPIQNLKDSNAIAELIDKPVNIVDDGSSKYATDMSYLRRIIQGDKIQVKLLYQNRFSIRLESRMVFVFNRIPRFRDDNDATAKKMLVIGFNRVYTDGEKDILLLDKLTTDENKEAFVKLSIDAMRRILNRNLTFTVSEESKRIVDQIIIESDQFVSFVADTITDDYDWRMFLDGKRTKDVYDDFWNWAKAEGYQNILVRRQFTERCCKESGARIRKSHGNCLYSFGHQPGA